MTLHSRLARLLAANKSALLFLGLMLMFRSAVADWMFVPSGSMNPTIVEGDRILVDKAAYGWRVPFTTTRLTAGANPQRGDIVIFPSPEDSMTLVKRVVGLPGDTIQMRDERVFVNDTPMAYAPTSIGADAELPVATRALARDYVSENLSGREHPIMLLPQRQAMRSFGPITVPPDHYFMLGDSRDNSKDSRYFGFVPRDTIVGRAYRVAYSLNADRWYLPRGDRFFAPLQ